MIDLIPVLAAFIGGEPKAKEQPKNRSFYFIENNPLHPQRLGIIDKTDIVADGCLHNRVYQGFS